MPLIRRHFGTSIGALNRGRRQTDLIIIDFASAFDKVAYQRLAYKLEDYSIRNDILQRITVWLHVSERTQNVIGSVYSDAVRAV